MADARVLEKRPLPGGEAGLRGRLLPPLQWLPGVGWPHFTPAQPRTHCPTGHQRAPSTCEAFGFSCGDRRELHTAELLRSEPDSSWDWCQTLRQCSDGNFEAQGRSVLDQRSHRQTSCAQHLSSARGSQGNGAHWAVSSFCSCHVYFRGLWSTYISAPTLCLHVRGMAPALSTLNKLRPQGSSKKLLEFQPSSP